jgi:hypothetical protein
MLGLQAVLTGKTGYTALHTQRHKGCGCQKVGNVVDGIEKAHEMLIVRLSV